MTQQTTLQQAQQAAKNAAIVGRPNDPAEEMAFAMMFAAVAQAEAFTRIAECMETLVEELATPGELAESVQVWGAKPE